MRGPRPKKVVVPKGEVGKIIARDAQWITIRWVNGATTKLHVSDPRLKKYIVSV